MNPVIHLWPRAKQDLIDHYAYIARDKFEPANRFLILARETLEQLAEMPSLGWVWETTNPRLAGVQVYSLPGRFRKYRVFYRPTEPGIEVLAVLHGAQNLEPILNAVAKSNPPHSPHVK